VHRTLFVALGAAALLGGCATTAPAISPTLAYDRPDCPAVVDTATAISLTPEKDKAIWTVDSQLVRSGPCLRRGATAAPYLVFALPDAARAKMVEIGAVLEPERVLSPKVVLLDAAGTETRSFRRDQYMFRPGLLSIQFVPQENERYALVTVDPEPIGESHDTIVSNTSTTTLYNGFGASNWRSGHETMLSRGFSYEGPVRALVYRPDKDD
jgi:hypothetical protein